jgi:hypothetical protein
MLKQKQKNSVTSFLEANGLYSVIFVSVCGFKKILFVLNYVIKPLECIFFQLLFSNQAKKDEVDCRCNIL